MKRLKQAAAYLLIASLTIAPLSANIQNADAAGKPSLSASKLTLSSGKTKTLTLMQKKCQQAGRQAKRKWLPSQRKHGRPARSKL